jgi:hypothetical protein
LTNSEQSSLHGGRIMEVINKAIEQRGKTEPVPAKPSISTANPLDAKDERITNLVGLYEAGIRIRHKDGTLGISIGRDFYPLKFYLDKGELVGLFGNYSELRLKPPLRGQNGSLIHINRLSGSCNYYDFHKPEEQNDVPGPNKPEWQEYVGRYITLVWGRMRGGFQTVRIRNGYLTLNGMRCFEYRPGLFFAFNGEALDFRGTLPTFRNIQLIKSKF